MNKKLLLGTALVGMASLFTACSDDNDSNPTLIQPSEFTLNTPAYVNETVDLSTTDALTLTWSQPKYTAENAPINATYEIQVSPTGNFTVSTAEAEADESGEKVADYVILDRTVTVCNIALTSTELAKALQQVAKWEENAVPAEQEVYLRANAYIAEGTAKLNPIASNAVKINVNPYYISLKAADPELWYLIGADIADGKWGNAVPTSSLPMQPVDGGEYNSTTGQGVITWTGYLAGGGFKLKKTTSSWDDQWGSDGAGGYVHNDGGSSDIKVSEAGIYTITLNTADADFASSAVTVTKYTEEVSDFAAMYITGSFNGWGTANPMTAVHTYAGAQNHDWYTTVTLAAGDEVKFYDGTDSWTYNSGGSLISLTDGGYGYGTHNGDNIKIETEGTYLVIYNDITRYYRFILQ